MATDALRRFSFAVLCVLAAACSSSKPAEIKPDPAPEAPSNEDVIKRFDQVKIGDSREAVERLLGRPYSFEQTAVSQTAMYMPGMQAMMDSIGAAQRVSTGASLANSALGSAMGLAGLAGPVGGIAAGIGSQILSLSTSAATQAAMPAFDPSSMEMLMVEYREGKVYSIRRQSMGGVGTPPLDETGY